MRKEFIKGLVETLNANSQLPAELFEKHQVKRGLRNSDGTGVVAGLTAIGQVTGYDSSKGAKTAVPGKLYYRGYDVEDIVAEYSKQDSYGFEEVCYLLTFAKLPTQTELDDFRKLLVGCRDFPDNLIEDLILKHPSKSIMNKLGQAVLGLYSYDENPEGSSAENLLSQSMNLISRVPSIAAYAYWAKKHYFDKDSLIIHLPKPEYSIAENLLYMLRADGEFTKLEAKLLDTSLMLHAEHGGGNNSAFTVHVISSSMTDTYSAITAGIGSLKGFRHGGASNKVIEMVDNIRANVKISDTGALKDYLQKILKKDAFDNSGLIYGFGHAVYTVSDPRAVILREKAKELAKAKGLSQEFEEIEKIADISHEFLREKKQDVCPNVDYYSGFVYRMLGIPTDLFTPLFAIGRTPSWCAHRVEEVLYGGRIIRPAYKTEENYSKYIPIKER